MTPIITLAALAVAVAYLWRLDRAELAQALRLMAAVVTLGMVLRLVAQVYAATRTLGH